MVTAIHVVMSYHLEWTLRKEEYGLIFDVFDYRRHKLSHGKPAYPCTFEDCERTFHRPDLLARHLNRQCVSSSPA